jgi:ABC-type transport system substrate-binding protein
MKRTRILLASVILAAMVGACSRSATEPSTPAAAPSYNTTQTDTPPTLSPPQSTTSSDSAETCRGGTVGSGGGRTCPS